MINEDKIKTDLKSLISKTKNQNPEIAEKEFVEGMTKIIVDAIKSSTIFALPGEVRVQGTATNQFNVERLDFNLE